MGTERSQRIRTDSVRNCVICHNIRVEIGVCFCHHLAGLVQMAKPIIETGSSSFSQDIMQVGLLLSDVALESPEEIMQTRIWTLHEELCQKVSKVAEQPMEYFYVSEG